MNYPETLRYRLTRMRDSLSIAERLHSSSAILTQRSMMAEMERASVEMSDLFYKRATDLLYEESVGGLMKVVNLALEFVFYDSRFSVRFDLGDARGVKTVDIVLVDDSVSPPMEIEIKDGIGQGVRTVVSAVMHIYYLINKGAFPLLLVDEAWAAISAEYIDRFFEFLKGLCKEKGLRICLISHDPRMLDYSDKRYTVSNGVVTEVIKIP